WTPCCRKESTGRWHFDLDRPLRRLRLLHLSNYRPGWYGTWSVSPGCSDTGCRAPRHLRGSSSDRRCCTPHCSQLARCSYHVPSQGVGGCRDLQSSRCLPLVSRQPDANGSDPPEVSLAAPSKRPRPRTLSFFPHPSQPLARH